MIYKAFFLGTAGDGTACVLTNRSSLWEKIKVAHTGRKVGGIRLARSVIFRSTLRAIYGPHESCIALSLSPGKRAC